MQIPSLISATASAMGDALKSRNASEDKAQPVSLEQAASTVSVSLRGIGLLQSASAPGMNADQLNSMVQTSLKMQAIHNDPSIPPDVKRKLLMPLEKANRDSLAVADAKAEKEEKSKMLEASAEDAKAIREAGEEIAESAEENAPAPAEPVTETGQEPAVLAAAAEAAATSSADSSGSASQPAASAYSGPASAPAVGQNVDTHS